MKTLQCFAILMLFQATHLLAKTPLTMKSENDIQLAESVNKLSPIDSIEPTNTKTIKRNSVYAELGGNGGLYSLNYDRILTSNKYVLSGRIGISIGQTLTNNLSGIFPMELNALIFNETPHHLEMGVGVAPYIDYSKQFELYSSFRIGYRYQNFKKNGVIFRAGFTPMKGLISENDISLNIISFIPWAGISLGYSF